MVTSDVEHIAYAIQDYLAAHPDGADNAEGVARWWLPGEGRGDGRGDRSSAGTARTPGYRAPPAFIRRRGVVFALHVKTSGRFGPMTAT